MRLFRYLSSPILDGFHVHATRKSVLVFANSDLPQTFIAKILYTQNISLLDILVIMYSYQIDYTIQQLDRNITQQLVLKESSSLKEIRQTQLNGLRDKGVLPGN